MKKIAIKKISAALALGLGAAFAAPVQDPWPFDRPVLEELRKSPKKVFAHYFTPFPISIDNKDASADYYQRGFLAPEGENKKHLSYGGYLRQRPLPRPVRSEANWKDLDLETEIRWAAELGIDGFTWDILSEQQWAAGFSLMDAAARIDPGFKIVLMPDMEAEFKSKPEKLAPLIKKLSAHPAAFRLPDGRLVVAPYNTHKQSAAWWKEWLAAMKGDGVNIAFITLVQGFYGEHEKFGSEYGPISAGFSDWGWRSPKGNATWMDMAAKAHRYAPIWMMPVAPQDFRPKSFMVWEAGGSENFRVSWDAAIRGGADWVQIITWNDYSEAAEIVPSTGTQYSFYDLTAFYNAWFKTGTEPKIVRDVLYYFHRNQSISLEPDPEKQTKPFSARGSSDPLVDEIELLAFLKAPGVLEIEVGGKTSRKDAPVGITSFKIPVVPGRPMLRLVRNGAKIIDFKSHVEIKSAITYSDLLYRGGSSSRPPVEGAQ